MYVAWRKRPVKGKGGGPFLLEPDMPSGDRSLWKEGMACTHRGEGRTAWTALLIIAERVDGKPRQRVVYRFPTIRTCCIADRFHRAAWWCDVRHYLDHVDDVWCEEARFLPRDRAAILRKLREVVPDPTAKGRAEFEAYRAAKDLEEKARDEARRRWWREEADRQERDRDRRARKDFDAAFGAAFAQAAGAAAGACFEVLGPRPDATTHQVKAAYRSLAKVHHPDRGGDAADFKRIKTAYDQAVKLARKTPA